MITDKHSTDMRVLADAIRYHRNRALSYGAIEGDPGGQAIADAIERVARTFARFGSAGTKDSGLYFLQECGIEE